MIQKRGSENGMKKKRYFYIKSGTLYDKTTDKACASIRNISLGPDKKILSSDGKTEMRVMIENSDPEDPDDLNGRRYQLKNSQGDIVMSGHPRYSEEEDFETGAYAINRLPKVDHCDVHIKEDYDLIMHNCQNYSLFDRKGKEVLRIMHKGIAGGWDIEEEEAFSFEEILGLFMFSRYIEKENEYMII